MRPLVEGLRVAGKTSTGPTAVRRPSGKSTKGAHPAESDPFGDLMASISLLLFGANYTGAYHSGLMTDFIQCGGRPWACQWSQHR